MEYLYTFLNRLMNAVSAVYNHFLIPFKIHCSFQIEYREPVGYYFAGIIFYFTFIKRFTCLLMHRLFYSEHPIRFFLILFNVTWYFDNFLNNFLFVTRFTNDKVYLIIYNNV